MREHRNRRLVLLCGCLCLLLAAGMARAEDVLNWDRQKNEVSADVRGLGVTNLLERVASETGWPLPK